MTVLSAAETAELRAAIERLHDRLVQCADAAEWHRVGELSRRRNALLERLPRRSRLPSVQSAATCNESLLARATEARRELGEQLAGVRRGRTGAKRYLDHSRG